MKSPGTRREGFIYAALLLFTAAVYWPVVHCRFLNLDDWIYVTANPYVQHGLTANGIAWAFRTTTSYNWHPITWLSHMLDCQLFGLNPAAHHLVNVVFHAANTLLLFHLLKRMTREVWPSAIVAALFALHPLHVESVAWIAERKDVLSTFFGLLTIWAYIQYARGRADLLVGQDARQRAPTGQVGPAGIVLKSPGAGWYVLALLFFALGLMSKPMLVTWPFVLLLLDYWPLERLRLSKPEDANTEATASKPSTFNLQPSTFLRLVLEKLPFLVLSIASSVVTVYAQRAGGSVMDLNRMDFWARLDNALVSYVRYLAKAVWPQHLAAYYPIHVDWPYWQVLGSAALLAAITAPVLRQWRRRPYLAFGWLWFLGTLVPVIGLVQVGGQAMADRYMYIPSIGLFVMVVWGAKELAARLGISRMGTGGVAAAALAGVTVTAVQLRYWRNSETLFRHALDVTSNNMMAEFLLGDALIKERKAAEGLVHLERVVQLFPDYAPAQSKIADVLAMHGRIREAIEHYHAVLLYRPDTPIVMNNLAWILATNEDPDVRDSAEAVRLAEGACALTRRQVALFVGTPAAAYADAGRFDDAVKAAQEACATATAAGETRLVEKNRQLLELYRAGKPYREPAAAANPAPAQ